MSRPGRTDALLAALVCILCALPASDAGAKIKSKGEVALEGRAFWPDDDDVTEDVTGALAARVEIKGKHKPFRERLRLLGRVDAFDSGRNVVIVEEAWVGFKWSWLRIRAGSQLLNWTATEGFHPADIINSRNIDSNIENFDKIGEPMASVRLSFWEGSLTAYYLPARMKAHLPGTSSRLNLVPSTVGAAGPLWVDRDGTLSEGRWGHQWAARLSQSFWGGDWALMAVQHNDRGQPTVGRGDDGALHPIFHQVTHFGLTWTQVLGDWVVKVEAAHRLFGDLDDSVKADVVAQVDHTQVAVGLEYGWTWSNGHEAIVVLEGQAVLGTTEAERKQLHPFQRDVAFGYRHTFNDVDSTEVMALAMLDAERPEEILGALTLSRRISDTWSAKGAVRVIHAPPESALPTGLQALHEAHGLSLSLIRHF